MKEAPQPCASTRTVLARARAAITPASTAAGSSTGAAGSGSMPLKTRGRPLSSRTEPTLPMTSPGGGSTSRSHRTATERPAIPATTGSELVARSPPTSQVTRTTWAAPSIAPRALSIPPPTPPSELVAQQGPHARADRLGHGHDQEGAPDRHEWPARAAPARPGRSMSCGASATMRTTATPAAASPRTWGIAPDRKPTSAAHDREHEHDEVERVDGRRSIAAIVREARIPAPWPGSCRAAAGCRLRPRAATARLAATQHPPPMPRQPRSCPPMTAPDRLTVLRAILDSGAVPTFTAPDPDTAFDDGGRLRRRRRHGRRVHEPRRLRLRDVPGPLAPRRRPSCPT